MLYETEQTELYFKYLQCTYVADALLANADAANMMNSMLYRSSASSSSYIRIDFSTALGNKHRPDLNIYEHHHHHSSSSSSSSSSSKHHTIGTPYYYQNLKQCYMHTLLYTIVLLLQTFIHKLNTY